VYLANVPHATRFPLKKLYHHLRDHIRDDFNWPVYGMTSLFLGIFLTINYSTGYFIANTYGNKDEAAKLIWFFALLAVPYLFVLLMQRLNGQLRFELRRPGFWLMLLFGLLMVVVTMWFPWHKDAAIALFPPNLLRWGIGLLWHSKRLVFIVAPMLIYVWYHRRSHPGALGLRGGDFDPKPYFLILMIIFPLILVASFRPDFQAAYPFYKTSLGESGAAVPGWLRVLSAEFVYGIDFLAVEWVYRGFFVLGMVKWLGPRAVLPMAALYCSIHFGKPAGEAVASFFGGYALGVFALKTKSVWGGVIVHLGVAWLMDGMAYLQSFW
jgi:hypothetical protein